MQRTWMVLGLGTPVVHHNTLKQAMDEAERLARLNPTSTFTVLEAIAVSVLAGHLEGSRSM